MINKEFFVGYSLSFDKKDVKSKKIIRHFDVLFGFTKMAGEERIELSITVLETAVMPLNYSPNEVKKARSIVLKPLFKVKKRKDIVKL